MAPVVGIPDPRGPKTEDRNSKPIRHMAIRSERYTTVWPKYRVRGTRGGNEAAESRQRSCLAGTIRYGRWWATEWDS
ncbi:hypothetical protein MLGJGCBP_01260 [Rhodococcus sp. T7]|nr:hypothetical protein MLGJGCBP_01260 [Rhodococcus sp. T7]